MDIRKEDGGGIVGTPLEVRSLYNQGPRSQYKISAADRIAPPQEVYQSLKEREKTRKERALHDETALHAIGGSNLYERPKDSQRNLMLADIMDEEDRAHMWLNVRTRVGRAGVQNNLERGSSFPVQFAAAATELPEVVPRARGTSMGHAILRKSKEIEAASRPKSRFSRAQSSLNDQHRLAEFIAFASLGKTDTGGLGYVSKDGNAGENQVRIIKRGSKLAVIEGEKGKKVISDADNDDLDDFANTGYNDLDSAADRIQLSLLRQRRKANEKAKESRKRLAHITGLDDADKILFSEFEEGKEFSPTEGQRPLYTIPASFSSKPVHDFEHDRYRDRILRLPDSLQQECDMLAKKHQQIYEREERIVKAAIAKAEEKREEKLRRIRNKFSMDMQSNFVAPSQSKLGIATASETPSMANKGETSAAQSVLKAEIGNSNRRIEQWSPLPLLCKRFGVSAPKNSKSTEDANDGKVKAWDALSASDDDDDFQIHAIIGADGRRVDFQKASVGLLADKEVIITCTEPPKTLGEKSAETNPSKELYQAIFSKVTEEERGCGTGPFVERKHTADSSQRRGEGPQST